MLSTFKTVAFRNKRFGMLTLTPVKPVESLEEARVLAGPMDIDIALDVSGSMIQAMETLNCTLGALVDLIPGSTLSIGCFDHEYRCLLPPTVVGANAAEIKAIKLVNRYGNTNLQDTLAALLQRPGIKILATDGLANSPSTGLLQSSQLCSFARSSLNYSQSVIHTLGIEGGQMNSDLLKTLALESGGIMQLANEQEGIPRFLGDVFAAHLYTRFAKLQISVKGGRAGEIATMLTKLPVGGAIVRSDMPTRIVFAVGPPTSEEEFNPETPSTWNVQIQGQDLVTRSVWGCARTLDATHAEGEDIARILGCAVVTPYFETAIVDTEEAMQDLEALSKIPSCSAIAIKLKDIVTRRAYSSAPTGENAQDSYAAYAMSGSSGGGDFSPQLLDLRAMSLAQSQSQAAHSPRANSGNSADPSSAQPSSAQPSTNPQ
jgi:hypothetical protein